MTLYKSPYPFFGGKSKVAPEVWQRYCTQKIAPTLFDFAV